MMALLQIDYFLSVKEWWKLASIWRS